ncbi:hypothetical protein LTR56_009246 [Elasticomyces elasticus]|nr:hypothetical protein LTR56_009246 [Elasticomyces elasticus]KAK3664778.1 hypothetical protein LTR22_004366 [Elasticomyces elasticus]KAK4928588.1 hypothetical protein LTR49_004709 [Elasticomyces elasticus]KAK5765156.1 hypothetical protein LTS12_004668 [Elasticomyces elasticus]
MSPTPLATQEWTSLSTASLTSTSPETTSSTHFSLSTTNVITALSTPTGTVTLTNFAQTATESVTATSKDTSTTSPTSLILSTTYLNTPRSTSKSTTSTTSIVQSSAEIVTSSSTVPEATSSIKLTSSTSDVSEPSSTMAYVNNIISTTNILTSVTVTANNNVPSAYELATFPSMIVKYGNIGRDITSTGPVCGSGGVRCASDQPMMTNSTTASSSPTAFAAEVNVNTEVYTFLTKTRFSLADVESPWLENVDGLANSTGATSLLQGGVYMTMSLTSDPEETITFRGNQTLLAAFAFISADHNYRQSRSAWPNVGLQATECGLFLTAQAVNATVRAGEYHEDILGRWSVKSWQGSSEDPYICDPTQLWSAEYNPIYHELFTNRSDFEIAIPDNPWGLPSSVSASQRFLTSTIEMFEKAIIPDPNSLYHEQPAAYQQGTMVYTADALQPLDVSKDLSHTFSNVANSMTVAMRNRAEQSTSGDVHVYVVHIQVEWAYLVLPAAVSFGAVITLAFAMRQIAKLGVAAWQGNTLATLLYGLDDETRSHLRTIGAVEGIDEACERRVTRRDMADGCEPYGR